MTDGNRKARDGRDLLGFTSHILVDLPVLLRGIYQTYLTSTVHQAFHSLYTSRPNVPHLYLSLNLPSTACLQTKSGSHRTTRSRWPSPGKSTITLCSTGLLPGTQESEHQSSPISSLSTGPDTAPIPVAYHALCVLFPCRNFRQLPVETPVLGKGRNHRRERMMRTPRPSLPKLASDQSLDRLPEHRLQEHRLQEHRLPEQPRWRAKWQPHQIATVLTSSKTFAWQACNHPPTSLLYTSVDRQARNHPQTKDQRPFLLLQHKSPAGRRSATMTQVLMA